MVVAMAIRYAFKNPCGCTVMQVTAGAADSNSCESAGRVSFGPPKAQSHPTVPFLAPAPLTNFPLQKPCKKNFRSSIR